MIYKISLGNVMYEVKVEQGEAVLLEQHEISSAATSPPSAPTETMAPATKAMPMQTLAAGESVIAPMPGTVVAFLVTQGQSVKKGQGIAILEAMKMENEVCSPADGVVASIAVQKGQSVETGAIIAIIS